MDRSDVVLRPLLKNRKTESEGLLEAEDRISRLPDGVICHILSFIPTKYSIRTSVLSKRWENLWALAPKIELDVCLYRSLYADKKELDRLKEICATFTHSVDNLFFLRDSLHIEKFKLRYVGSFNPPPMRHSSWLCSIIMCNVRELDLQIRYTNAYLEDLPRCLFTCKTLVILKLSCRFILNVPYCVCLPKLKILHLAFIVYLDDASFPKLLSGCPILEDLKIIIPNWDQITLNLSHPSLKRLSLDSYRVNNCTLRDDDHNKIKVDAPNLEFINITNWSDDILLKPLPEIIEARVDIVTGGYSMDKVIMLLQNMVNVRRLYLSECAPRFLNYLIQLALPTFCNLVRLELDYDSEDGLIPLMNLLRSSPKLEALYLPRGVCYNGDDSETDSEFSDLNPEQVPECLHHSLKIVEIKDFHDEEVGLNLVEYMLENAMVLEKMTIFCWHRPGSVGFDELKAKLIDFVWLSTTCQLDLLYSGSG